MWRSMSSRHSKLDFVMWIRRNVLILSQDRLLLAWHKSKDYINEETVGEAIKKSNIKREDIYVTAKYGVGDVRAVFDESLQKVHLFRCCGMIGNNDMLVGIGLCWYVPGS